jgi:hypothetical protein
MLGGYSCRSLMDHLSVCWQIILLCFQQSMDHLSVCF